MEPSTSSRVSGFVQAGTLIRGLQYATARGAQNWALGSGELRLGPPVVPSYPFLGEGSPTKIDYRKKVGTLVLASQI